MRNVEGTIPNCMCASKRKTYFLVLPRTIYLYEMLEIGDQFVQRPSKLGGLGV